ncbi:efflux RND transporter permease subunit [Leptospira sp. GIMC2001]|uniref:efflux RND transporter permease subunit n=1 Tax=Leptospira sp. GIMC2001 TaxID=1513297 RepID=UPI002349E8C7|nr:efflux RND transporter permease subunit [Leptospira sp. GIMC2001]WCL50143.1 efflux RND transporter permease subunit [Leptospira sp. GIMC2001]
MDSANKILDRTRFFWMIGIAGTMIGLFTWFSIPKEEDPRLKARFGFIKLVYPGASVPQIKKYVVEETERELASVEAIAKMSTTIRSGFAAIRIEFKSSVKDDGVISRSWDEVQDALDKAYKVFPQGALAPDLDRRPNDQESILIAIEAPLEHRHKLLLDLENKLLVNPTVSRLRRTGDEGSQLSIQVEEVQLANSGISVPQLIGQIQLANTQIASGYIESDGQRINIQASNIFENINELKKFPIATANGSTIPLSRLAKIELEPKSPPNEEFRWNGKEVYGLGVIAKRQLDLRAFGESVNKSLKEFELEKYQEGVDFKIHVINSQPNYVKDRLTDLAFSLLSSVALLSTFMIIFMGFRVGIAVSVMLPVISLIAFALYGIAGGILHQIAIAAFVLSFGILIDNIVVIVESIQEKINSGKSRIDAGSETIKEFTMPLLSSTITTIAAFLPMALAEDTSAEFTEAIPKIVIVSLIVSFFASIFLSPSLALKFLKPQIAKKSLLEDMGSAIANVSIRKPKTLYLALVIFLIADVAFLPFMRAKFFPSADRNQMIMILSFPEGTSYDRTRQAVIDVENSLFGTKELKGVASFVGRSTPFFYYNLPQKPNVPNLAQFLLISEGNSFSDELLNEIRSKVKVPDAEVRIKSLEQGPPAEATIIVRVYHPDLELWKKNVQELSSQISAHPDVEIAWSDSIGNQKLIVFETDDKRLSELGSNRREVSLALLKSTYGIQSGFFKTGDESIPIVVSSQSKEKNSLQQLSKTVVGQTYDRAILTDAVAEQKVTENESVHLRYNRRSYVSFLVDMKKNGNSGDVIAKINDYMEEHDLLNGVDYEFDGEKGNSDDSNNALFKTMPIGMTILLATLIWQFNSYKLLLIILTTVPTAFLGMIPGLVISGQPFGFLPLLALFALIGIAVNNGIILIDKFQLAVSEGNTYEEAVRIGVSSRLRPILLTSGSTILGMIPLGFSSSTLWPPFAWSMVSGLLISSISTLFIIPRLYLIMHRGKGGSDLDSAMGKKSIDLGVIKRMVKKNILIFLLSTAILGLIPINDLLANDSSFTKVTFRETLALSSNSLQAKASFHDAAGAKAIASGFRKTSYLPNINVYGERVFRDQDLFLNSPFGQLSLGNRAFYQSGLELYQPLWSPRALLSNAPSAELLAEAALKKAAWENQSARYNAATTFVDCVLLDIRKKSFEERAKNLDLLISETKRLAFNGNAREVDIVKIQTSKGEIERGLIAIENGLNSCRMELGRLIDRDIPAEPLYDAVPDISLANLDNAVRDDIRSFQIKIESISKDLKGIEAEEYPEVYAKGNLIYSDQGNANPYAFSQLAVGVKMNIFDGGLRARLKNR